MAPVVGVVDLGEAVGARRGVDADRYVGEARIVALDDVEAAHLRARGWHALSSDTGHARQGRRIFDQQAGQFGDSLGRTFHFDQHARTVVQHIPGQAEGDGMAVHEWAEADALHSAGDPQPLSGGRGESHGSADARERVAHEHVDDPGPTEAG